MRMEGELWRGALAAVLFCFAPTHLIRAIFDFGFYPVFSLCAEIALAVVMASQMSPTSIAKIHQLSVPADNNRVFGSSFGSFFSGLATGNRLHLKNSGCRGSFPLMLSSQRSKRSTIIKSLVRIFPVTWHSTALLCIYGSFTDLNCDAYFLSAFQRNSHIWTHVNSRISEDEKVFEHWRFSALWSRSTFNVKCRILLSYQFSALFFSSFVEAELTFRDWMT